METVELESVELPCGHEWYIECRGCRSKFCVSCCHSDHKVRGDVNLHFGSCELNFPKGPKVI